MLIVLYLIAIVIANLTVARFGPPGATDLHLKDIRRRYLKLAGVVTR